MRLGTIGIITFLILGNLLTPACTGAQPEPKVVRVGLIHVGVDHVPPSLDGLREGLNILGYEEGKNVDLDWRNLPDEEAARETAKVFAQEHVDLIVAFENQSARAAKNATAEIPIVFLHAYDPVGSGLVSSQTRPGGNLTGFEGLLWGIPGKRLELFKEIVPTLRRIVVLKDPDDPLTQQLLVELRMASEALNIQLVEKGVKNQAEIESAFGSMQTGNVDGVFVVSPNLQVKFPTLLISLANRNGLALPGYRKEWVEQGALFSYAPDIRAIGRDAATYVDKILRGTSPGDLPIDRTTRFELVINQKVADAMGILIPEAALRQATEVVR